MSEKPISYPDASANEVDAKAYEDKHVQHVYDVISEHFSETRFKVMMMTV